VGYDQFGNQGQSNLRTQTYRQHGYRRDPLATRGPRLLLLRGYLTFGNPKFNVTVVEESEETLEVPH
jgi:hypothetical protein